MTQRPKNFCYTPWTSIEIMQDGRIVPCCKFVDSHYEQKFNIATNSVADYQNGRYLADVKQEFLNGKWPLGCERCRVEEESHTKSKRNLDYVRWQSHYDEYDLNSGKYLTLGAAFGTTCNLKCIICNPYSSSSWQKEYKDLYGINIPIIKDFRKSIVKSITKIAPELIHIDIYGGEPFLSEIEEHKKLLNYYVQTGQAQHITIHYTTNGTIFPDNSWFDIWDHFKEVDLQLSIDGVGDRFEYLRFPANWDKVEDNVKQYTNRQKANFRLSVSHTVSAFNIYYLDEIFHWCKNIGLPVPWIGQVHAPVYLSPFVWPEDARLKIVQHLFTSRWPQVKNWSNIMSKPSPAINLFQEFVQFVNRHDQYRKLDFKKTFPELANYI
jgi:MoaA/NifB/PqqE/SkfB family radical SAM enzyme